MKKKCDKFSSNFNYFKFSQANVSAPLPPRPAMEVDEQPPPAPVQKLDTITAKPTEPTVVQDTFSGSDLVGRSLRVDSKAEDESKMEVETKSPSPVDRKKIKIDEVTNEESKEKGVLHVVSSLKLSCCNCVN